MLVSCFDYGCLSIVLFWVSGGLGLWVWAIVGLGDLCFVVGA